MVTPAFHAFARPFARGLLDKAEALTLSDFNNYQRSRLVESMAVDVRKACDVLVPAERLPEVSHAAFEVAEPMGIDLHEQTWHGQPQFDKGRQIFHYEHKTPVGHLVARIRECESVDQVVEVLSSHLRLAWILKAENRELNRLGYTTRRPDPDAAYAAAGISLLPRRPDRTAKSPTSPSAKFDRLTWGPDDIKISPPKSARPQPRKPAEMRMPPCGRCMARATWLVTGSVGSNAPGRILTYCDRCRDEGWGSLGICLPLTTFRENPTAILHAIYRSGASGTDPAYVAELFGLLIGPWARSGD